MSVTYYAPATGLAMLQNAIFNQNLRDNLHVALPSVALS